MSKPMTPLDPLHPKVVVGGIPFATWLRGQLARLGWGVPEAARRFNVSVEVTRGYLRGFTFPTPVTLARIETAVGEKYNLPSETAGAVQSIPAHTTVQAGKDDVEIVITVRVSRSKLLSLAA